MGGAAVDLGRVAERVLALEIRRAVLWLPVLTGLGIWLYLAWAAEPPGWTAWLPLAPGAALALSGRARRALVARTVLTATLALLLGHSLALLGARAAEMPRLPGPVAATLEGRVVALDRAASGAPRVLLERVTLFTHDPARTPGRVRVTLLDATQDAAPRPGEWIHLHATLLPPGLPVEPGGFDFARRAFFERIGAIGYARTPAIRVAAEEAVADAGTGWTERVRLRLAAFRLDLADAIRATLPGPKGAFAAAIVVGDRSAIAEEDSEALRISSLAHLLAISGLHMGMLTGLVFAGVRLTLALPSAVALRWPVKKVAAVAALAAGACYLLLSGATVATQRAFVMVAVMFVAVLLDRPAISLRALALAAAIVLAIRPISIVDAGFQMSFAATVALVAAYEEVRRRRRSAPGEDRPRRSRLRRLATGPAIYVGAVLFTSLVAGLATAPYSGFHFNRFAPWGLLANLAAVPVMGAWIAPAAVVAALAAPFGLAGPPLEVMGLGIGWVLDVAHRTAALPGADAAVAAAPEAVLALVSLGGLWLAVWRGTWRLLGLAPLALGLALWHGAGAERPVLLVAPEGRLVGLMTADGRALDDPLRQSYAAETWLRRDGDGAEQADAARRPGLSRQGRVLTGDLGGGWRLVAVRGRTALPADACRPRTLVIATGLDAQPAGGCAFLGSGEIGRLGAVAVRLTPEGPSIEGSAPSGLRPWHPPQR